MPHNHVPLLCDESESESDLVTYEVEDALQLFKRALLSERQLSGLLLDKRMIDVCQIVLGFHSVFLLPKDIQPTNAPK